MEQKNGTVTVLVVVVESGGGSGSGSGGRESWWRQAGVGFLPTFPFTLSRGGEILPPLILPISLKRGHEGGGRRAM